MLHIKFSTIFCNSLLLPHNCFNWFALFLSSFLTCLYSGLVVTYKSAVVASEQFSNQCCSTWRWIFNHISWGCFMTFSVGSWYEWIIKYQHVFNLLSYFNNENTIHLRTFFGKLWFMVFFKYLVLVMKVFEMLTILFVIVLE